MSREMLKDGHDWILTQFYSRSAISRRLFRQFGYLPASNILRVTAPLNLGYRYRLSANGTLRTGAAVWPGLSTLRGVRAEVDRQHPAGLP